MTQNEFSRTDNSQSKFSKAQNIINLEQIETQEPIDLNHSPKTFDNFEVGTSNRVASVSYTHLDVYKRQTVTRAVFFVMFLKICAKDVQFIHIL